MAGIPLNRTHIEAALTFEPANRHNADLTGAPLAPTPETGDNSRRIATTAFVRALFDALVDAAPGVLDTLNELAAALGDDPNFAATMAQALAGKQPLDALLTGLSGVATAGNKLIYATGSNQFATTDLTGSARTLLAAADAAAQRGVIGVYSTAQMDAALGTKAPISNPSFTGNANVEGSLSVAGGINPGATPSFYLGLIGSDPLLNLDANDFLTFDRSVNELKYYAGGVEQFKINDDGVLRVRAGATVAGQDVATRSGNLFSAGQVISAGAATSGAEFLRLSPTDFGLGKPYLTILKEGTADHWAVAFWDGSGANNGTLNFYVSNLTGPTPAFGDNSNRLATTAFVKAAIDALLGGAGPALDTLNELAAALGDDPNFATTIATALAARLRVDTAAQGLSAGQQANGRANLGLGSAATYDAASLPVSTATRQFVQAGRNLIARHYFSGATSDVKSAPIVACDFGKSGWGLKVQGTGGAGYLFPFQILADNCPDYFRAAMAHGKRLSISFRAKIVSGSATNVTGIWDVQPDSATQLPDPLFNITQQEQYFSYDDFQISGTGDGTSMRWAFNDFAADSVVILTDICVVEGAVAGLWTPNPYDVSDGLVDIRVFGVVLDGIKGASAAMVHYGTDNTAALNRALASGKSLFWPDYGTGLARITDKIRYSAVDGQTLTTANNRRCGLLIDASTFNMAASSVVELNGVGQCVDNLYMRFRQPNTSVKSELYAYPKAIDYSAVSRARLTRNLIELAWDGLIGWGNVGGSYILDNEVCAYNIDLSIDGAADACWVDNYHCWCFGVGGDNNLLTLWLKGEHDVVDIGRCDDFNFNGVLAFTGRMRFHAGVDGFASFGHITNLDVDATNSQLAIEAGEVSIANLTVTRGDAGAKKGVVVSGGKLSVVNFKPHHIDSVTAVNELVSQTGGEILITNIFGKWAVRDNSLIKSTAGYIQVFNGRIDLPADTTHTAPVIDIQGTARAEFYVTASDKGSGTGTLIKIHNDNYHKISVSALGWDVELPPLSQRVSGSYNNNIGVANPWNDGEHIGSVRRLRLPKTGLGTFTGATATVEHGIVGLPDRAHNIMAIVRDGAGSAPTVLSGVTYDGTNIYLSGGAAGRNWQIYLEVGY